MLFSGSCSLFLAPFLSHSRSTRVQNEEVTVTCKANIAFNLFVNALCMRESLGPSDYSSSKRNYIPGCPSIPFLPIHSCVLSGITFPFWRLCPSTPSASEKPVKVKGSHKSVDSSVWGLRTTTPAGRRGGVFVCVRDSVCERLSGVGDRDDLLWATVCCEENRISTLLPMLEFVLGKCLTFSNPNCTR